MQEQLMKYSPDTGEERPYPSNAKQWREYHGRVAWLYNPWTGEKRDLRDIGSDVFGKLIVPDTEVRLRYCCEVEMPESSVLYDLGEEKVYSHYSNAEGSPRGLSVSQTLDDTEATILEAVQSAERLLLGTTMVSYWVKYPLADKSSRKLTREKETLVYVSGNTKTKYYCATENVAILAQSLIVLIDDNKADDFPNTLKRRFYELTPFQREILANNYTKVEHYRDDEWRTKKGTYFHKDGIYRVGNKHEGH